MLNKITVLGRNKTASKDYRNGDPLTYNEVDNLLQINKFVTEGGRPKVSRRITNIVSESLEINKGLFSFIEEVVNTRSISVLYFLHEQKKEIKCLENEIKELGKTIVKKDELKHLYFRTPNGQITVPLLKEVSKHNFSKLKLFISPASTTTETVKILKLIAFSTAFSSVKLDKLFKLTDILLAGNDVVEKLLTSPVVEAVYVEIDALNIEILRRMRYKHIIIDQNTKSSIESGKALFSLIEKIKFDKCTMQFNTESYDVYRKINRVRSITYKGTIKKLRTT